MLNRILVLPSVVAIAAMLTACGSTDAQQASGQVAAKVNGQEISVRRVDNAIAGDGGDGGAFAERGREAAAQTLERIIDQELLVQKALEAKLDRDPQVMQALEAARRRILAQAYVDRTAAAGAGAIGREEIEKFYAGNPALFKERRIYRLREIQVNAPRTALAPLEAEVAAGRNLDEIAAWLKSRKLPFHSATSSVRPAERVPLKMLLSLAAMRDGQIAVFAARGGASVVERVRAEEAPLSEEQAAPVIARYLQGRKRLEAAQRELKKLRARAKIEYLGDFRKPAGAERDPVERGFARLI